jgi:hypothetical protein
MLWIAPCGFIPRDKHIFYNVFEAGEGGYLGSLFDYTID